MPLQVTRRIQRHFVVNTDDGPLVTVYPTRTSFLPPSFKSAAARSIQQSREGNFSGGGAEGSPSKQSKSTHSAPVMHHRGGPVLVFAAEGPLPDGHGVPADEEETRKRERLGTIDRRPCALCLQRFDSTRLRHSISRKAIIEQQALWGRTRLEERDLKAGNLYESCRVCVFCYQFFDETMSEASTVIQDDAALLLKHDNHQVTRESSTVSSRSGHRELFTEFKHNSFSGEHSAPPTSTRGNMLVSAIEEQEEERQQAESKFAKRLLQCLDPAWEGTHRALAKQSRRTKIHDFRADEIERWENELAKAKLRFGATTAVTATASKADPILVERTTSGSGGSPEGSFGGSPSLRGGAVGRLTFVDSINFEDASSPKSLQSGGGGADVHNPNGNNNEGEESDGENEEYEFEVSDDIRHILANTPRALSNRSLYGDGSPSALARVTAQHQKQSDERSDRRDRPASAIVMRNKNALGHKAVALRQHAAKTKLSLLELEVQVQDCERRGIQPPLALTQALAVADLSRDDRLAILQRSIATLGLASSNTKHQEKDFQDAVTLLSELRSNGCRRGRVTQRKASLHVERLQLSQDTTLNTEDVLKYHGRKRFSMYSL